ncbi:uncharacterized protein PHACADRAFT_257722 [Phanerochaete carnosa HHB-10118-sp]|uniref:Very-long-chain 3-oxoacyl-CoA reductase n=1 Tax=Phanerochaete carnosa (strain HHB-10118-sp) TaxID=650164 RepID=K5W585_PHACS|nr:uncharacterized protein PHACADRAFT_257722 [Phanerochaete carnosa HHB-10118-sp]EKM54109.1 hypothetical protein PHACADRAFT_257722 [Phanerochaete carnosa HHB-10118-sp]
MGVVDFLPFRTTPASHVLVTDYPVFTTFLLALGALTFGKFVFKFAGVFLQTFILPGKSLKKYGAGKGAWAVVTGASEGIGREYALQLAKKGFNVVVSARNKVALDALINEIQSIEVSGKKMQACAVAMDFSKVDDVAQWSRFETALEGLDIGVLVNNVGKSHSFPSDFVDAPVDEVDSIIAVNVNSLLKVTRIVLPGMISRHRGLILASASFAGVSVVSPMLAPYAASKAFLATFNSALGSEVKGKGIDVETANTHFVISNMSKIRKSTLLVPPPKLYVKAVLAKIGLPCGALFTGRPFTSTPYWSHALLDWFIHVLGWRSAIAGVVHNMHRDIRRRALRKLEREAKKQ